MEYLTDMTLFLGGIFILIGISVGYVVYKRGSVQATREHFSGSEGKGILKGLVGATLVVIMLSAALGLFNKVVGEEVRYLDYGSVYAGMDYTKKLSPQCEEGAVDDHLTSNVGFTQQLVGYRNVDLFFNYTHHSCVLNVDDKGYDGVGMRVEWKLK